MNAEKHFQTLRDLTSRMQQAHGDAAHYYLIVRDAYNSHVAVKHLHLMQDANRDAATCYRQRREAINAAFHAGVSARDIGKVCRMPPQTVKCCVENWHLDRVNFDAYRQARETMARAAVRDADGLDGTHPSRDMSKPAVMPHKRAETQQAGVSDQRIRASLGGGYTAGHDSPRRTTGRRNRNS